MKYAQRLLECLSLKHIDHRLEILKEASLKDAHIYCKVNHLPGQISGTLIETYIQMKFAMTKNKATACSGDLSLDSQNIEVKISLGGVSHDKFNYVQLRLNHDIDYYLLTAYYLSLENVGICGELFVFKVNKEDIKAFILKYGSYAHGSLKNFGKITIDQLNETLNDREYCMRPRYNSRVWHDLLKHRTREFDAIF
jgi:hypothetical protein